MASRGIRGRRMRMLNDLGFGEVSRIYVEEAGSVRALCKMIFTPRYEGEEVGCSSFYDWLKRNNYQEIWKETIKKHLRKWRRLPGLAFEGLDNSNLISIQGGI